MQTKKRKSTVYSFSDISNISQYIYFFSVINGLFVFKVIYKKNTVFNVLLCKNRKSKVTNVMTINASLIRHM